MIRTMSTQLRSADAIVTEYNTLITELLKIFELRSRAELERLQVDRLRKRIHLVKSTLGAHVLIEQTGRFLFHYYTKIVKRDEEFFTALDVRTEFKLKDGESAFIVSFSDNVRNHYLDANAKERNVIYRLIRTLLDDYMEWLLVTGNSPIPLDDVLSQ